MSERPRVIRFQECLSLRSGVLRSKVRGLETGIQPDRDVRHPLNRVVSPGLSSLESSVARARLAFNRDRHDRHNKLVLELRPVLRHRLTVT